jgi:hypothetical protein
VKESGSPLHIARGACKPANVPRGFNGQREETPVLQFVNGAGELHASSCTIPLCPCGTADQEAMARMHETLGGTNIHFALKILKRDTISLTDQ